MMDAAPPRLLLVEDSDTQALEFRRNIEAHGFRVERTRTAEEALEQLNGDMPDLLVVDYRLPGMNGDELVRIVRQSGRTRTLPVLMLTGNAASEVERQGLDSGANAYVAKGLAVDLLVSRLRALLRKRRGDGAAPAGAGFRQAHLLVVEDNPDGGTVLSGLLAGDGHDVCVAASADCFAALGRTRFDCVLIGLSGAADMASIVERLDAHRSSTGDSYEIVALGGEEDGARTMAALAAGADDVVEQTADSEMLLVRIRATVRRKLARDEEMQIAEQERERALALARAQAQAQAAEALAAANRELAAANVRLQETQAQLVQSAKMASLGELVAGIAHEINNPLAFILAHQATVEQAVQEARGLDGDARDRRLAKAGERLASIRTGLVRIQDLVVKLRRFSRIDDGESVQLDIAEAIDAVLTILQPRIPEGVVIERDYRAAPTLRCSPALVNQVVMNIVSNAVAAVPAEGGRVRIETSSHAGNYRIAVSDNGPGIPAELRARAFEPFFTTKDVGEGTGLGLAIAYGVVRSHGGSIEITDGSMGGAMFVTTVPLHDT